MSAITAFDLKNRGISSIEEHLAHTNRAFTSVQGQERYVVMSVDRYHEILETEIETAWMRVKANLDAGRYRKDSVAERLTRISDE